MTSPASGRLGAAAAAAGTALRGAAGRSRGGGGVLGRLRPSRSSARSGCRSRRCRSCAWRTGGAGRGAGGVRARRARSSSGSAGPLGGLGAGVALAFVGGGVTALPPASRRVPARGRRAVALLPRALHRRAARSWRPRSRPPSSGPGLRCARGRRGFDRHDLRPRSTPTRAREPTPRPWPAAKTLSRPPGTSREYCLWGILGALWVLGGRGRLLLRGPAGPARGPRPTRPDSSSCGSRPPGRAFSWPRARLSGCCRGRRAGSAGNLLLPLLALYFVAGLSIICHFVRRWFRARILRVGSVRPGRLLSDQRRGGAPGALRLVRGFSPTGRGSSREVMKVILADDVRGLGHRGDTVTVKPGYARNFLFPQGVAYEATDANVRRLTEEKKKYDEKMLQREVRRRGSRQEGRGHHRHDHEEGRRRGAPLRLGHRRPRSPTRCREEHRSRPPPHRAGRADPHAWARTRSTSACTATSSPR